jgi:hypothetical protein
LSQVARHLTRPLPNSAHNSAGSVISRSSFGTNGAMTSSPVTPADREKRTIHTAGCIIIGDEVLNGKVRSRIAL